MDGIMCVQCVDEANQAAAVLLLTSGGYDLNLLFKS